MKTSTTPLANELTRRRFLQAMAITGTVAALPTWLADAAAAATPIGATDGVLVVVWQEGGNDGLNTVAPVADGAYVTARGRLAVTPATGLAVGSAGVALHPSLVGVKQRYDAGQVAVLLGVGDTGPDLSHSIATTRLMGGDGTAGTNGGWLGRYLDGLAGADPFHAVSLGSTTPLLLTGRNRRATVVGTQANDVLSPKPNDAVALRALDCLKEMGTSPTGLGPWGNAVAAAGRSAIDVNTTLKPTFAKKLPDALKGPMELAARLVNADLGIRVVHVRHGGYDTHVDQSWRQADQLKGLDEGISQFFASLDPRFAGRATVAVMSEFGRRVQANSSGGTDHGTASNWLVVGQGVRGGTYAAMPSLTALDGSGNMVPSVDHRAVYATLLDRWLGADSGTVLGGRYEDLGFLTAPRS